MKLAQNQGIFIASVGEKIWSWGTDKNGKLLYGHHFYEPILLNYASDGSSIKSIGFVAGVVLILTNGGNIFIGVKNQRFSSDGLMKINIKNVETFSVHGDLIICLVSGNADSDDNGAYIYNVIGEQLKKIKGNIKKILPIGESTGIFLTDSGLYRYAISGLSAVVNSEFYINRLEYREWKLDFDKYDKIIDINCSNNIIILSVMENNRIELYIGNRHFPSILFFLKKTIIMKILEFIQIYLRCIYICYCMERIH